MFFFYMLVYGDGVKIHKLATKTRLISSLDQTSFANKGFIRWLFGQILLPVHSGLSQAGNVPTRVANHSVPLVQLTRSLS